MHPRIVQTLKKILGSPIQSVLTLSILFIVLRKAIGLFDSELVSYVTILSGHNVSNIAEVVTGSRADWGGIYEMPDFCKRIITDPQPFRRECKRNPHNMSCANFPDETLMFSQFKQDFYLFTRHFAELKRPGVYLDVATNDPVSISNTFFLDRCLRWKGVCVEANPTYYEKIHRLRSCQLVPTCVGRRDGEQVDFGLLGGAGGIMGRTNKHMEKWMKNNVQVPSIRARCTTMQMVLDRGNIRVVDYMSLDVEGHEVDVLMGFDWSRTRVNVMSIEVSGDSLKGIEKLMNRIGYKRHIPQLDQNWMRTGRLGEDVIFLHPDVVFGSPA